MIKKVLIGVGIIVIVAGLVCGILYAIKKPQATTKSALSTVTVLDHSKDYGACNILDTVSIQHALGDSASNLQKAQDMGILQNKAVGSGVADLASDSQLCVYAFVAGGTLENGYNSNNALNIEIVHYRNSEGPASLIKQIKTDSLIEQISGLGDAAFYSTNTSAKGPGATYNFKLQVFVGNTLAKYTIYQPAAKATFTDESAKTALQSIATASLAKVK